MKQLRLLSVAVVLLITACSSQPLYFPPEPEPPVSKDITAQPYVDKGMFVCPVPQQLPTDYHVKEVCASSNQYPSLCLCSIPGVMVYHVANSTHVIIPSDLLFDPDTATIRYHSEFILFNVSKLIKNNKNPSVTINVYTDHIGAYPRAKMLTDEQAESIKIYLWGQGLDINRLHAKGMGINNPRGNSNTQPGHAFNRRIEIVF